MTIASMLPRKASRLIDTSQIEELESEVDVGPALVGGRVAPWIDSNGGSTGVEVGARVGVSVGARVGVSVGARVGVSVGARVGARVGAAHAVPEQSQAIGARSVES